MSLLRTSSHPMGGQLGARALVLARELTQPAARMGAFPRAAQAGAPEVSIQPSVRAQQRSGSQLLCSETLTARGRGSWRGARNCLRGQGEGGREEGGCNGMAGCPGFMGHNDGEAGAGGRGRPAKDCGEAATRLEKHGEN